MEMEMEVGLLYGCSKKWSSSSSPPSEKLTEDIC